jgi:hypothetical protein
MTEPRRHFVPHEDAERFDAVTVETIERWKESELSGDEWRFSHVAKFWRKGQVVATINAVSIEAALLSAAHQFSRVKLDDDVPGGFYGDLEEMCAQPACDQPWTVLLHPVKRYAKGGGELARPYSEGDVRGFCERHKRRGDCGLDDADDNYVEVETRFPRAWGDSHG